MAVARNFNLDDVRSYSGPRFFIIDSPTLGRDTNPHAAQRASSGDPRNSTASAATASTRWSAVIRGLRGSRSSLAQGKEVPESSNAPASKPKLRLRPAEPSIGRLVGLFANRPQDSNLQQNEVPEAQATEVSKKKPRLRPAEPSIGRVFAALMNKSDDAPRHRERTPKAEDSQSSKKKAHLRPAEPSIGSVFKLLMHGPKPKTKPSEKDKSEAKKDGKPKRSTGSQIPLQPKPKGPSLSDERPATPSSIPASEASVNAKSGSGKATPTRNPPQVPGSPKSKPKLFGNRTHPTTKLSNAAIALPAAKTTQPAAATAPTPALTDVLRRDPVKEAARRKEEAEKAAVVMASRAQSKPAVPPKQPQQNTKSAAKAQGALKPEPKSPSKPTVRHSGSQVSTPSTDKSDKEDTSKGKKPISNLIARFEADKTQAEPSSKDKPENNKTPSAPDILQAKTSGQPGPNPGAQPPIPPKAVGRHAIIKKKSESVPTRIQEAREAEIQPGPSEDKNNTNIDTTNKAKSKGKKDASVPKRRSFQGPQNRTVPINIPNSSGDHNTAGPIGSSGLTAVRGEKQKEPTKKEVIDGDDELPTWTWPTTLPPKPASEPRPEANQDQQPKTGNNNAGTGTPFGGAGGGGLSFGNK
jgi:hypothetical protein